MKIDKALEAVDTAIHDINFYHEIDFCLMMIKLVNEIEEGERPALLKHISENFRKAETAGNKDLDETIGQQELKKLKESYGAIVDGLLDLSLKGNPDVDEFYGRMGANLLNPIFDTENSQAFCLYYQLVDKRIPYFKLKDNPLKLADDAFESKLGNLSKQIENIRHILARDFEQKTMEADNLLDIIDSCDTREDKAILLTAIISRLRAEYELLKRRIDLARR